MATQKTNNTHAHDFKGRELTAVAVTVAAIGSASLNTWGAFHIFPNPFVGWIIAGVILSCEAFAFLVPRHIVKDWDDRHYWKARGAAFMLMFAIAGCVFSGKHAFGVLFLEADQTHKVLDTRADAREAEAAAYHAGIVAGTYETNREGQPIAHSTAVARWERMQDRADDARLAEMKAKPPHQAIVYILLALFEMVKIGGLFFAATQKSERGLTRKQRQALKRREKLDIAKAEVEFERKLDNVVNFEAA